MKESSIPLLKHIPNFLDYCDVIKGLSLASIENYKQFLKKFIAWLNSNNLQDLKPHELTQNDIYKFRLFLSKQTNKKDGKTLKKNTTSYYLIALRSLLSYFTKKGIVSLPADAIELPRDKSVKKIKCLDIYQIEKLLLSPSPKTIIGLRDRAIVETLFSTGMRVGELVALDREQTNIDLILKNNLDELELPIIGKGDYTRTVYFSHRALEALIHYLRARKDNNRALFINLSKNKITNRLTTRSVDRIIKKYVIMSGLPVSTTPHTLRHSYATDLLNHGVDIRSVQEFLGHRSITTTQIYTHITNKRLKDIHKKFHSGERLKK